MVFDFYIKEIIFFLENKFFFYDKIHVKTILNPLDTLYLFFFLKKKGKKYSEIKLGLLKT